MRSQKDAWDELYRSGSRPWRGVISTATPFPFSKGDKVLDIGCGNGKTSSALIEAGYDVTGIDISEAAVEMCIRLSEGKIKAFTASADAIPLDDATQDGVVMVHVLEHIGAEDMERTMKEVIRVLRPEGKLFVRAFHKDDMRADNGERIDDSTVIRGNGIRYHYFTESELKSIFSDLSEISLKRIDEMTKFNKKRSRIEAVFKRTA